MARSPKGWLRTLVPFIYNSIVNNKYDKIKSSKHHTSAFEAERPGHDLSIDKAAEIIAETPCSAIQEDGRKRYWGYNPQPKLYRVVVSTVVSAGHSIGRVVTAYRDREKNIGKDD